MQKDRQQWFSMFFQHMFFGKGIQDLESLWINQGCNPQKHRKVLPEQAKVDWQFPLSIFISGITLL